MREILGILGYAATDALVRILGKIPPEAVDLVLLYRLRKVAQSPALVKLLTHLDRLSFDVVELLWDEEFRPHAGFGLLRDAGRSNQDKQYFPRLLRDTLWMMRSIRGQATSIVVNSSLSLHCRHGALAEQIRKQDRVPPGTVFRLPPAHTSREILPITTGEQLALEGRQQHNCVASYWQRILAGELYIYKMFSPERATIALEFDGRTWTLGQIAGPFNASAASETIRAAKVWLDGSLPRTNRRLSLP
jgi:hypothetical protein